MSPKNTSTMPAIVLPAPGKGKKLMERRSPIHLTGDTTTINPNDYAAITDTTIEPTNTNINLFSNNFDDLVFNNVNLETMNNDDRGHNTPVSYDEPALSTGNQYDDKFTHLWSNLDDDMPMTCVNPMELEGKQEMKRPNKLNINTDLTAEPSSSALNTPALDENMDFDFLDFLVDDDRNLNDPQFKSYLNPGDKIPVQKDDQDDVVAKTTWDLNVSGKTVTMSAPVIIQVPEKAMEQIKIEDDDSSLDNELTSDPDYNPARPPVKRGPGRPRVPRTTPLSVERSITKRPRGRPLGSVSVRRASIASNSSSIAGADETVANDHAYSFDQVPATGGKGNKYRRMRDLNNEASKRCRAKRKSKMQNLETEMVELEKKNQDLRIKHDQMKELVDRLKKTFLQKIANPQPQVQQLVLPVVQPSQILVAPSQSTMEAMAEFQDIFDVNVINQQ